MPTRAPRPCSHQGCPALTDTGWCAEHRKRYEQQRGSAAQRGYDSKWRRARAQWLAEHPWCAACEAQGRQTPATMVDHIVPHRGDLKLMWNRRNWQSLDDHCHAVKRQRESMEVRT